jgi:hypothetical protein
VPVSLRACAQRPYRMLCFVSLRLDTGPGRSPFHENFERMVEETGKLYGAAKEKHAAGVELLCRDFGYHPAYKRWHDTFSSTPWKPQ